MIVPDSAGGSIGPQSAVPTPYSLLTTKPGAEWMCPNHKEMAADTGQRVGDGTHLRLVLACGCTPTQEELAVRLDTAHLPYEEPTPLKIELTGPGLSHDDLTMFEEFIKWRKLHGAGH